MGIKLDYEIELVDECNKSVEINENFVDLNFRRSRLNVVNPENLPPCYKRKQLNAVVEYVKSKKIERGYTLLEDKGDAILIITPKENTETIGILYFKGQ